MRKDIFKRIVTMLSVAILLLATGCNVVDRPVMQGVTNFDSITLSDDLIVGDDLTIVGSVTPPLDWSITEDVVITGTLQVGGASDLVGNVSDSGGAFTIADNTLIDGAADAVQLTVQGYSTQTSKPFVVENSAGTDQFTVSNTGDVAALGEVILTKVNAAGGSANPIDYTGTLGIMDNSDDFTAIDINITNADHTGSGNTIQALDVGNITGDAQATEYAINVGTGWDRGLNIAGGGAVIVGTVTLDAGEIGAAEIANPLRSINIPLQSFIECTTNGGALIDYSSGADAFPDFINSSTDGLGFVIAFDDTGGSVDTAYICSQLSVPADYASGGAFVIRTTKDAQTADATEVINCAGSIDGAGLLTGGVVTVATNASTSYTCTPTLTALAVGDSLSFELHITSATTVDDVVNFHSVEFQYTATQ